MKQQQKINHIETISQLVREFELPAPLHPLIVLVDYGNVLTKMFPKGQKISLDFYKISFKPTFKGKTKYGQGYYDFEEGGLAFLKPKQVVFSQVNTESYEGFALYFHPDFIRNYSLSGKINQYGFFSYMFPRRYFYRQKKKKL